MDRTKGWYTNKEPEHYQLLLSRVKSYGCIICAKDLVGEIKVKFVDFDGYIAPMCAHHAHPASILILDVPKAQAYYEAENCCQCAQPITEPENNAPGCVICMKPFNGRKKL